MNLPIRLSPLILLLAAAVGAQTAPPASPAAPPKQENAADAQKPATLDAQALAYGAELEKQASPALKKWAKPYAKKEMSKRVVDLAAARAAVDARFPVASGAARAAAAYLLLYTACQDQYQNVATLEGHLGIKGGSNPFAARRAAPSGGGTQRYGGPTVNPRTGQITAAQGNSSTSTDYLFSDEMATSEVFVPANLNTAAMHEYLSQARDRADAYTRLLNEAHQQLGATPPGAIREIR